MSEYKLTIITVCYNSKNTIRRCISSVVNQINENVEYIIIDGKSKDNTIDIIREYCKKYTNVKYISEPDDGIYDAMNKGIKLAKGEWIYFLNSDDELKQGVLNRVLSCISSNKYDCIYGDIDEVLNYKEKTYTRSLKANKDLKEIKNGMIFSHQSFFARKNSIISVGTFDTQYNIAADWNLILRLYLNKYKFYYLNETIANFYIGGACSKSHILERHRVRKNNKAYKVFDKQLIRDIYGKVKSQMASIIMGEKYNKRRLRLYELKG